MSPSPPGLPQQIGRYLIRRLIGSGGMGDVFEAMQEQPRRIVALKIMRPGVASASALRRFEYESQVLARLQHPGIAQIFEAGTHRDPRYPDPIPYFAMEYIAMGTPITEYAADRALTQHQRLALMSRVCDAVAHGHAKGVIHRDLKPSNILVNAEGNPKIIDFGVARGTDSDQARATLQTDAGQIIGTLQYMSPEQCSDDPRTLDARSDVYSLGIILFELLCGRLPYNVAHRPLSEATRIIRESPLPLPSSIDRAVRGDAETIILRAITKDRDRRYQSAAALKEDIDRCLAGEPIMARRDSAVYLAKSRVRSLTARNYSLAAFLAVLLAVLAAAFITTELFGKWQAPLRAFERLCDRLAPSDISRFDNVRLIAISDSTDVAGLAAAEHLADVTVPNKPSLRRLHGRLLEKLAAAQPGVVMFDIRFKDFSPFDEDMAAGAKSLSKAGADTVVACHGWDVDAEGSPALSPVLAPVVRWGSDANWVGPTQLWRLQLARRPKDGESMLSLTLRTFACLRQPGADASAVIEPSGDRLTIRPFLPNPRLPGVRAPKGEPCSLPIIAKRMEDPSKEDTEFGLRSADTVAAYQINPPPDRVFDAATWDYARAMTESPDSLRSWCTRKVVIVFDGRKDFDRHKHPDGRVLPGAFAQATGLEQMLRLDSPRLPSRATSWFLMFLGAGIGLLCALPGRPVLGLAAVGVSLLLLVGASLLWFVFGHVLANPIFPGLALVLCAGIVLALPRPRTRPI